MTPAQPSDASEAAAGGTSHDRLFKTLFEEFLGNLLELIHPELGGDA